MNMKALDPRQQAVRRSLGQLTRPVLGRYQTAARVRLMLMAGGLASYWSLLAFAADFPRVIPPAWMSAIPFPINVLLDLLTSLFAPQVILHLIPVMAGLWLGMRLGAHYLADLFELDSPALGQRYLMAALFGLGYETLNITQGDVELLQHNSTLVRIGGPGYLRVHLGFAAVLETAAGQPRVYGPNQRRFVQGFERLRDVVDLRDQLRTVPEVQATTADGIEVRALDVRMVFRVYGGEQPRSLEAPYPYTESAIRRLVYGRLVSERGSNRWTDALDDLVVDEIQAFVGSLTLEGFLALQPGADRDASLGRTAGAFHIPRRKLTERFHTPETRRRLQEKGLELDWAGVGTWEVRGEIGDASQVSLGRTLVDAWKMQQRKQLLASPGYLERQRTLGYREGQLQSLERLARIWHDGELRGSHRCWALADSFRKALEAALAQSDDGAPGFAQHASIVVEHLRSLTSAEELGGPSA